MAAGAARRGYHSAPKSLAAEGPSSPDDWDPGRELYDIPPNEDIRVYVPDQCSIAPVPELALAGRVRSCSEGCGQSAALTVDGNVLCAYYNRPPACPVGNPVPWTASKVSCGYEFFVAVREGGGAVCSWGKTRKGQLGHPDGNQEVSGLPPGDPVVDLEVGRDFVIVTTTSGAAYSWGNNHYGQLSLGKTGGEFAAPCRSESLSQRRLLRVACGWSFAAAESAEGGGFLLGWGCIGGRARGDPVPLPFLGHPAFPLRGLAASSAVAAADANGKLWALWEGDATLQAVPLPAAERVARVAVSRAPQLIVALTAEGRLWDCRSDRSCRTISLHGDRLDQAPWPCGGAVARRVLLLPDTSCGVRRLRLLVLAAARRDLLPGGEILRAALAPYLVDGNFIFER
eukprot:TRINITY_DN29255_c0_g1_i1.p1 TRINITY_DN29255_c0_g1~~TRINITY_DN29255_c0_g1_i1.p1  ORF type:complete len:399 (+),score=76.92 TRINITY_DN29255_c0_g1_i1:80-1276(+)